MVFNSAAFLVFFLLFYFVYWWINNRKSIRFRNSWIVLSSFVFYGWWDWRFLLLLVFSAGVDFVIGPQIAKTENRKTQKRLLLVSLLVNLGILGVFKYFNFFVDSLHAVFSSFGWYFPHTVMQIILPVGISFYTFQALSYTIDIYRKRLEPTKDVVQYFAFISFFPQLVAGPIERAAHLLPQFNTRKIFSYEQSVSGLRLLLFGFFKKIVIADNFGVLADGIFSIDQPNGLTTLVGILCFSIQIYADFSGYSDIAIGVSRMLGFDLMTNFRTPYFARNFTDFWSRWHISLSTWFRDYVYIPLGGNREGEWKTYRNLFLTFLLSGLWHGAAWTFVIWGALHGFALVFEKMLKRIPQNFAYRIFTVLTVIILWLPFRAQSFHQLKTCFLSLFSFSRYNSVQLNELVNGFPWARFVTLFWVALLFFIVESRFREGDFDQWIASKQRGWRIAAYYFIVIAMLFIGNFSVKPSFIYFQF